MPNIIEYDAATNSIDSVVVFQSQCAEVCRKLTLSIKEGQNEVEIKNLPTSLNPDSIRVDGIGKAVIFDVVYHPPLPVQKTKVTSEEEKLLDRRRALENVLETLEYQLNALKSYATTLAGGNTSADQMDDFLNKFSSRKLQIDEQVTQINKEIKSIDENIQKIKTTLNTDTISMKDRGVCITVVVLGEEDGEVELSLIYLTTRAVWTPHYDLRANIAYDTKVKSTIALQYRASVSQTTGEDWKDVKLTLSTAKPLQGAKIPILKPRYILPKEVTMPRFGTPPVVVRAQLATNTSLFGQSVSNHGAPEGRSGQFNAFGRDRESLKRVNAQIEESSDNTVSTAPGFFGLVAAQTQESAVSTTFTIIGLSSIPSSSQDLRSRKHNVSIATINLESLELSWITAPSETPSVFLQCSVKNTSDYALLAGETNIFMNNNFVAKSQIPHVSPQENFSCSLGADAAVKVTYHPQIRKWKSVGGSAFNLGSQKKSVTSFVQNISIKNTRLTGLRTLIVRDKVFVSQDERFKVDILEPKELRSDTSNKNSSSIARTNINARWTEGNRDEPAFESSSVDKAGTGLFEWVCESVGAGMNLDLTVAWDVVAPAGLEWQ